MTTLEYSYTESDVYRAIVQTAVPIALTAEEIDLVIAALIELAATMPHDTPAGVFAEYQKIHAIAHPFDVGCYEEWDARVKGLTIDARRTASLERITRQYPSLTETER